MVPSSMSREIELFQASPLTKKFFVVIEAAAPQDLGPAVKIASDALQNAKGIRPAQAADKNFLLSFLYYMPFMWTESLQADIAPLLAPQAIEEKMQDNIMALMSPQGRFLQDFITADPLGFLSVAARRLEALNITGGSLNFNNGFLSSPDGTKALLLFDAEQDSFDRGGALSIIKEVDALNALLPEGARAFSMGAARYTQENNDIIARDVKRVLAVSFILTILIFLLLFRSRGALFIYAVPTLVLVPTAVFTYFGFGAISGITLGFGSVLMGLANDYSVYIYYAFRGSAPEAGKRAVIKALAPTVMLSGLTAIISFVVIYFCAIPLFEQISVFTVGGLIYSLLISFFVAPLFFKLRGKPVKDVSLPSGLKPFVSLLIVACIIGGGVLSVKFLKLDTSLDSLNTVTARFDSERRIFDDITGHAARDGSLLFVFGEDQDAALERSLELSRAAGSPLGVLEILFSSAEQQKNIARWRSFWTDPQIEQIKNNIDKNIRPFGIKQNIFNGFYAFLGSSGKAEFDLTKIYNPFTRFQGREAVVHVVPGSFNVPQGFGRDAVFISQNLIQEDLFNSVFKALGIIITIIFIVDFTLLMFTLKNFKLALLSFVPVLCAISMILIVSAVFGIRVNLFSLFAIPLLIGICVDYAIFIIHKQLISEALFPSMAVVASALLSLAGFGALIFAAHKVLFAIGFAIAVGVVSAGLVTVYLMPGIVKKVLKIAPVLLLFFLAGCAGTGPKIIYGAPAPQTRLETTLHHGEIGGNMLFSAVSARETAGRVRVITLNEFGIKLADMSVTKEEVFIHFKINFFPKRAAAALAQFYRDFYFNNSALLKEDLGEGKISYNNKSKKIVLWVEE